MAFRSARGGGVRERGGCWHRTFVVILLAAGFFAAKVPAIETDQYLAWGTDLEDSTDLLNAWVRLNLQQLLDRINAKPSWREKGCSDMIHEVSSRFRIVIFSPLELWANNSPLVDRSPSVEEEAQFRDRYIYRHLGLVPMGEWMPPGPTIRIHDVYIGTDKLTHFFSEGRLYHKRYVKARGNGLDHDGAVEKAIRFGILSENLILGKAASGVFSVADLEANYQGLLFLLDLCAGDDPFMVKEASGWRLRRQFDFRHYVTPEWDESYQPSIFSRAAWKKIRPVMLTYCESLGSEWVDQRRQAYRQRDRKTLTESILAELVAAGELPDPQRYSIEATCSEASAAGE